MINHHFGYITKFLKRNPAAVKTVQKSLVCTMYYVPWLAFADLPCTSHMTIEDQDL
jgi:hypothetical protein